MNPKILIIGLSNQQDLLKKISSKLNSAPAEFAFFSYVASKFETKISQFQIFLIADFTDSVNVAKQIHKMDASKNFLFLISKDQKSALSKRLHNVVTIGHSWELCDIDDDDFIDTIKSKINFELHHQKFRTTLHVANNQIIKPVQKKVPHFRKLLLVEKDLKLKKAELEKKTLELKKRVNELEQWERLTVGRELRIVELKKKVKELEQRNAKKSKKK